MNKDHDAVEVIGKIILPIIRKVHPTLIAQQITSVQPMTMGHQGKVELRCGTAYLDGSKKGDWFTVYVVIPFNFSMPSKHNAKGDQRPWCIETFGPESNDTWFERDSRFYFRNEADQSMFVLRWTE